MTVMIALQLAWLSMLLAVVTVVDIRTQTIPDIATAALAGGGVVFAAAEGVTALLWALAAGLLYFALFWSVRRGHWRLTGRIGMGFGDVKFAGAAGLWLTPALLPLFLAFSAFSALVSMAVATAFAGANVLSRRIPFGPFLALGVLGCWLVKVSDPAWGLMR